ncbi:MAG: hypothetical protein ABI175_08480, partial [Polyangiales bacterium]
MKTALLLVVAVLGACGSLDGAGDDTNSCSVTISSTPTMPIAGPTTEVRLISTVTNSSGTHGYTWNVTKGGTFV